MSNTFFRVATTFNNPNLTKLSRDLIINDDTRFVLDFGKAYCYPAQVDPIPSGTNLPSLVDGSGNAQTLTAAGTSINFIQAESAIKLNPLQPGNGVNCLVKLPPAAIFTGTTKGFLIVCWFTQHTPATLSDNNVVLGYAFQNGTYCQYLIQHKASTNIYIIRCNGATVADLVPAPAEGALVQFAISYNYADGRADFYRNGTLVGGTNTHTGALNDPLAGNANQIPSLGIAGAFTQGWDGKVKRVWADESANTNHAARVLADYNANLSRLSAA
jgi:hypothetical protein